MKFLIMLIFKIIINNKITNKEIMNLRMSYFKVIMFKINYKIMISNKMLN
jgi:hypothetical protein